MHSVYTSPAKHRGAIKPWPTKVRKDSDGARDRVRKATEAETTAETTAPPIVPFPLFRTALATATTPPIHAPEWYPPRTTAACVASDTIAVECVTNTSITPTAIGAANLRATRLDNGLDAVERSARLTYLPCLRTALEANIADHEVRAPPLGRAFDLSGEEVPSRRPLGRLRADCPPRLRPIALIVTHAAMVTLTKHTAAPNMTGTTCHTPDRET
jgi:hypothetical protein